LPPAYYAFMAPQWLRTDPRQLSALRRAELNRFGAACRSDPQLAGIVENLFDRLLPRGRSDNEHSQGLSDLLNQLGFDRDQHEQIRADLKNGRTGLAQNRLPSSTVIEDVRDGDVVEAMDQQRQLGREILSRGEVAVLTLAAGAG